MNDSISTDGPQRPRVRRGLGVVVGVTLMAAPLALAPAAQAQAPAGPDTASTVATLLQGIIEGLAPQTLPHLLGERAPNTVQPTCPGQGLSEGLTCVIGPLQSGLEPGTTAKAKVKATMRKGKARSVRWVSR